MCASLSYRRQQAVSRQLNGCHEKKRSPRRSESPAASSPFPQGMMTRVTVSCYVPTLTQGWGVSLEELETCCYPGSRSTADCKVEGSVLVAGFILSTKGPCIIIRRTSKNIKMDICTRSKKVRQSWTWKNKGKKKLISNYSGYYLEWMKEELEGFSYFSIHSYMDPLRNIFFLML